MKMLYVVILVVGFLAIPVGFVSSLWLVRTLRVRYPEVLKEVDPAGFRTFYLPSQLRFYRFIARGGLRPLADRRVHVYLRISIVCFLLVATQVLVATFCPSCFA